MATDVLNGTDMNAGASYSGGALPADADNLIVPKSNTGTLTNLTALTLIQLTEMIIESGHQVDIGGSGNGLAVNADRITHRGSGTLWFDGGTGGSEDTDIITVNSPALSGDGALQLLGGNLAPTRLYILNGKVVVGGSCPAMTDVLMSNGRFVANDNSNAITSYTQTNGVADCTMVITSAWVYGGTFVQRTGRAITNLYVGPGARVEYESAATITRAVCAPGGFLNLSPKDGDREKTVTTLVQPPGANVHRSSLVTVTNLVPSADDLLTAGLAQFGTGSSSALN